MSSEDQVGGDAAGRGRVHHAVTAEAVDEIQPFNVGSGADDSRDGRESFRISGPGATWVHLSISKAGNTRGRMRQNLFK